MTSSDHRIDTRDWWLLALLSLLWGGSFFFVGFVIRELPPLTVVLLRVTLAAIILLPVLWAYRIGFPRGLANWRPFFAIALLNNVLPFSLIVTGQTYISSGLASILNATTPLFTVLVMAAAGDEKLHARRVAGVVIGLIGVAILHGQYLGFGSGQGLGILLCLAAAFSYGLSALYARRKLSDSPPLATATFQMLASSVMMVVIAGVFERPWQLPMPGLMTWLALLGLAVLSTALAYIVFFSDPATIGLDQCHAGDAADSRHRHPARLSRAGRTHHACRDRRRAGDRQRAAGDRRPGVQPHQGRFLHSESHPVNRPLSRPPPGHAAVTAPSLATSRTASRPFERRRVSIAWRGVCAIGPATLNEVLTDISTPICRPSAFRYA